MILLPFSFFFFLADNLVCLGVKCRVVFYRESLTVRQKKQHQHLNNLDRRTEEKEEGLTAPLKRGLGAGGQGGGRKTEMYFFLTLITN